MLLKDRTKKRLRWFVIGLVTLTVGGTAAYFARDRYIERRAVAGRDAGLKLLEAGDYFHAMHSIGPFVRRHPNDATTLFAYARARQHVPEQDGSNLRDAVSLLRRVMSLDPHNIPAAQALLDLYRQFRMLPECLQLSNDVLAMDANNRTALKSRATALCWLGTAAKLPDAEKAKSKDPAMDAALHYSALWPTDLEGQLLTLNNLSRRDGSGKQAVDRAKALHDQFPKDPRFVVLQSIAQSEIRVNAKGDRDFAGAVAYMTQIAAAQIPDAETLQLFVQQCDQLQLFDEAYKALQRFPLQGADASAGSLFAGRLWQLKLYDELVERFPATVTEDGQSAALRCLALYELGKKDQAVAALGLLHQASEGNASAKMWSAIIDALHAGEVPDDVAVISSCRRALLNNEKNPYIQYILAAAYQRTGQTADAIQALHTTQHWAPAWSEPVLREAEMYVGAADANHAAAYAELALQRQPNDRRAMLCQATAQAMLVQPQDKAGAEKVLGLFAQLGDEPKVTVLRAQVLATAGRRDEAVALVQQALTPAAKTSAGVLIQLAFICQNQHLGLTDACFDLCEKTYGPSPDLAFAKAKCKIASTRSTDQALADFDKARSLAAGNHLQWDMAWAELLELTGDARAKDAWISLAQKNPSDIHAQWLALDMNSVKRALDLNSVKAATQRPGDQLAHDEQSDSAIRALVKHDRQSIRAILDSVKDDSLTWRMDQALWLKTDTEKSSSAVEAALLLNEVTRRAPDLLPPKLMLADCLRTVDPAGAIDQLVSAEHLANAPNHESQAALIQIQLATLLQTSGDTTRARTYAERVLANPAATSEECVQAARIAPPQNDAAAVATLETLKRAFGARINDPPPVLVLAQLYYQTGQPDNALKVCAQLLKANNPDFPSVAFSVDLYDALGRGAEAEAAVKLLDKVAARPGEKELVLASHALRVGDRAKAIENFTAVTRAVPTKPLAWRQLVRLQMIAGDEVAMMETARLAVAATKPPPTGVQTESSFAVLRRQAPAAFKIQKTWPEVLPLTAGLMESPDQEPTIAQVLKLLPAGSTSLPADTWDKLNALASAHPRLLPLVVMTVRSGLEAGRTDDACALARGVAEATRGTAETAQFATVTYANVGRWKDVLDMATLWRDASRGSTLGPDRFIATAYTNLGNASAALDQLAPHLAAANAEPARNRGLIVEIANLEAVVKSKDAALDLLRPHLAEDAGWRLDWMKLVVTTLEPKQAAAKLSEIESKSLAGDAAERLAYTESWEALAHKSKQKDYADHAAVLLERVTAAAQKEPISSDIALQIGCLHEAHKDLANAEKFYRKAAELDPRPGIAQNNLAMLLAQKGEKLDDALAMAEQAAGVDTDNRPKFYDTLAFVQDKRHDYAAGMAAIQRALKLQPKEPQFQIHLAMIYADMNQMDQARAVFEQLKPLLAATTTSQDIHDQLISLQQRLDNAKSTAARAS